MTKALRIPEASVRVKNAADDGILAFLNKDISIGGAIVNDKLKERYYNDLNVLLSAGVDLKTALEMFANELDKKKQRQFFNDMVDQVIKGKSLSSAMENKMKFSKYECVSIRIGEETGELSNILKELSAYFMRRIKLKRQVISVFSYPFFLLTVTFGVLYFMLNNVVPMFADIFQRFGKELPPFTLSIIRASDMVKSGGLYFLLIVFALVLLIYGQRKKEWFRSGSAWMLIRLPVFGKLVHKIYLSRFCQSMQLLVAAKVPLVEALALVRSMIDFYPIEEALDEMSADILKGKSLHEGMAKFPFFDRRMVSLVRVSEEVNSLDSMFARLTVQYNDEVEHRTSVLGSLIEPLMILLIGVIVGVILVAMYQPLFNISNILE
jgi:type IV pilus assembly protein PilC